MLVLVLVSSRSAPPRFSRLAFPRALYSPWAKRLASPIALVLLWQIGSMAGVISPAKLAAPSTIATTFVALAVSGDLWRDVAVSLGRVAAGFAAGAAIGVTLALIVGLWRPGDALIDPPLQMLRALPYLGMTPLLILWFGIGEAPKIALVAFAATFPIYLTLLGGIRAVDPKLVEAARVFGLDRWQTIRHVVLPSALAPALVSLRYALGAAWLSLVVGEQINADRGIGFMIMDARDFLRTDVIMVGLLLYALLGLGSDAIVRLIERRALAWRPRAIGVGA